MPDVGPGLGLTLDVLFVVASIVLLWKGADWVVDAAARIARRFNVSELVIGLTLIGFGTSAPEFAVSIGAAITDRADISVGNIVGSNVFNLGFILGGIAMIRPIQTSKALVYRDGVFLVCITFLLATFITDRDLSRLEGTAMFVLLAFYLVLLFFRKSPPELEVPPSDEEALEPGAAALLKDLGLLVVALVMVVGGSRLLVIGASGIASAFGMSDWAIGVTIVAAGTSAPEVVTVLNAGFKGKHGISAGALIGSDIYNLLGVLGVAAAIRPMEVTPIGQSSVYVLVCMVCVVLVFLRTGWRIGRLEGTFLVVANAIRWYIDLSGVELF